MANESKQVNYSNFDFFKLDSMSLPEITVGSDGYGSLLNPDLNAEENSEQTTVQGPEISEPSTPEAIQLPAIESTNTPELGTADMLPPLEDYQQEPVVIGDMLPQIEDSQKESIVASDILPQIEGSQQEEQKRINDLINESNEIIYNQKSSLEVKIKELEAKILKMDTEELPSFKAAVTSALNMDRDRPVNIKPGYADDIGTFLTKINSPPTWRAMSN